MTAGSEVEGHGNGGQPVEIGMSIIWRPVPSKVVHSAARDNRQQDRIVAGRHASSSGG